MYCYPVRLMEIFPVTHIITLLCIISSFHFKWSLQKYILCWYYLWQSLCILKWQSSEGPETRGRRLPATRRHNNFQTTVPLRCPTMAESGWGAYFLVCPWLSPPLEGLWGTIQAVLAQGGAGCGPAPPHIASAPLRARHPIVGVLQGVLDSPASNSSCSWHAV